MTPPNAAPSRPVSAAKVILIVSAAILVMLVVAAMSRSANPGSSDLTSDGTNSVTSDTGITTGTYRAAAQELVKQHLHDPSSAEFSDIRVIPAGGGKPIIVCGKVNSKNGFGGMNGAKRFVVGGTVAVEEEVGEADMNQLWATFC
ncbi:hypothetical protein [Sphingomonas sp. PB4P5]|uniref:hypothetical protein n=1 Tax=Parasphingomonas puruogangriensis TaxID=3096155 RepID=UPI002FCC64DF